MAIATTYAHAADRADILALLAAARGDDLDAHERARRGFVQGRMDAAMLARFEAGSGVFAAREGDTLAGVCVTSLPGMVAGGRRLEAMTAVAHVMPDVPREHLFLYGPAPLTDVFKGAVC